MNEAMDQSQAAVAENTSPNLVVEEDVSSGAKFVRADLHIHSFGEDGSFDVKDATMTPENIVDTAIAKDIPVIAITDHNEIGNVRVAIKHAKAKGILVIPGIEVTTTQGHLLVYFETFDDLRTFHGRLTIDPNKERCSQGITECLTLAEQNNGIGILAHIEIDSGFEKSINRFGREMDAILTHRNLYALEIARKESAEFYTDSDGEPDRRALIAKRREVLDLESEYQLAKVMSSDSHSLARLGTNADGENKLTRIKLDEPTFHSFKVALMSANSRIRLEGLIPEKTPRFKEMRLDGGLLHNQIVKFSPNLTCIIGGRGAGKSTLLQALQECSGNTGGANVVDSEVWPQKISLIYEDETGREIELVREKNSCVQNLRDSANGITVIPIEGYGQGETAETIQHSDKNPKVLIDFLDRFIDLRSLRMEEAEVRQLLIDNQSDLRRLRTEVSLIGETQKTKSNLDEKIRQLKKDQVEELVSLQTGLIKERELRIMLLADVRKLAKNYEHALSDTSILDEFNEIEGSDIVVGKDQFERVKSLVTEFGEIVAAKSSELNVELEKKIFDLHDQIKAWSEKESTIQKEIDDRKAELEGRGIPFDLGLINQLAKDQVHYSARLKGLLRQVEELRVKTADREGLLKRRKSSMDKIYYSRQAFATIVNENLKHTVEDFLVTVKYKSGAFSPEFEDRIKGLMQWKTARVPKAEKLSRSVSPLAFAAEVKGGRLTSLKTILDDEGGRVFEDSEIANIRTTVFTNEYYEDFETLKFDDLPSITVTKMVDDGSGTLKAITKSLFQLSLGQQQAILLAILLQSKSSAPLVIDQPEDNLDSEFIYKTIVANLRRIKESRQVIVVSHNANIAVLGDAELIVPLKSTNVRSTIIERGSIDKKATRKLCCEILEGGERAFVQRKKIYGLEK